MNNHCLHIENLFRQWSGTPADAISPLPLSGSNRKYFRIQSATHLAIGVYNPDKKENAAFTGFTRHFLDKGLNVPQLYAEDLANDVYLIQDLGDTTLFAFLAKERRGKLFSDKIIQLYRHVVEELPRFQISGGEGLDYSLCYPRQAFDRQSMQWDLNYFKYYFLKLARVSFDEQLLEDDFRNFINWLLQADSHYFLYRDFQSRNIMVQNDKLFFIDYQGGRRGALQYDLASLLYDAKADLSPELREELLEHYLETLSQYIPVNAGEFRRFFYGFVLIRIMQAMGAYGYRGFYEKKELFLQSIPYVANNIKWLIENEKLPVEFPALTHVLHQIASSEYLRTFGKPLLKVMINSFSFKRGIPVDLSGNGGGFVFDCRALPNPGRYEEYKTLTGNDQPVIDFLESKPEIQPFKQNVFSLVDQSVDNYLERGFANLMVNFGCTGGQHRSAYFANQMAKHLTEKYHINIVLTHRELSK